MDIAIGLIVGLVVGAFLTFGVLILKAGSPGGVFEGLGLAAKAKEDAGFAAKLQAILAGAEIKPLAPPRPAKPDAAPLRMLALLQAESRLVDFLMEDISSANDAQIGQAVREIHKKAAAALRQHATIEPVLQGSEGDSTRVPSGFDPSAIRVVGNVTGSPPFAGSINHPGWRVTELKVAAPPEGADEFVLQPAEVQIQ